MKIYCLLLLVLLCQAGYPQAPPPPHPSVSMTWTWVQGTGDPATGFHVQRGATAGGPYTIIATIPVGTFTYLDTNVTPGSTWYYIVTAFNSSGDSGPSPESKAVLPFIPPLPIMTAPTVVVK